MKQTPFSILICVARIIGFISGLISSSAGVFLQSSPKKSKRFCINLISFFLRFINLRTFWYL